MPHELTWTELEALRQRAYVQDVLNRRVPFPPANERAPGNTDIANAQSNAPISQMRAKPGLNSGPSPAKPPVPFSPSFSASSNRS
jgi:hypothetical protein